jgi:hypothetical protein
VELQFHPSFHFPSVMTLRGPSGGHCVELQFHPSFHFPSVMTLRGPSGGHCVELSGRKSQTHAGGPKGPQRVTGFTHFCPLSTLKLHAVAPGGPPEGQCEWENRLLGKS